MLTSTLVRGVVELEGSLVGDPSLVQYPTLELRQANSCTLVENSIAIAALYRTLIHSSLPRNRSCNADL